VIGRPIADHKELLILVCIKCIVLIGFWANRAKRPTIKGVWAVKYAIHLYAKNPWA